MNNLVVESELRDYIDRRERLLWTGQPKKGLLFRTSDLFLIPFSLFWCGFAIFWTVMASKASFLFALFGIPFVIIGLVLVFGRFIIDAKLRASTFYGITEERIIIKSGLFTANIQSLNIQSLSNISYSEKKDGTGTINLGNNQLGNFQINDVKLRSGKRGNQNLELISDVRNVHRRILDLQKKF